MSFPHRKSLISNPNLSNKFTAESCYLCYICPDNCYLSPPPPPPSPPPSSPPPELSDSTKYHIPMVLILMLCILGFVFLILSYLTISRYKNSRSRNPSPETLAATFADENHRPVFDHPIWQIRTVGLSQSVIDSIASFAYQNGDGLIDGNDCSVCLNDFRQNETLRLLPKCSHAFHLACIDTWLRSHKNCPVCRAPVVRDDVAVKSSSSSSEGGEIEREGNDSSETRPIVIESDHEERSEKVGVGGDVADQTVRIESFDCEVAPVRRSVSVDLSYEVGDEGCSDHTRLKGIEKQSSSNRVNRSFSFSGNRKDRNGRS